MLTEKQLLNIARTASQGQNAAQLETLVQEGFLSPGRLKENRGQAARDGVLDWKRRVQAFVAFASDITTQELHHDALIGTLAEPLEVFVHQPRKSIQTLVEKTIEQLLPELKDLKEKHPDRKSLGPALDDGVGFLLAGAVITNVPRVVQSIVRDFPEAAQAELSIDTFGDSFRKISPQIKNSVRKNSKKIVDMAINPACLALRLSREECLDAIVESKEKIFQRLGSLQIKSSNVYFGQEIESIGVDLLNLHEFMPPGCTPAIFGKAMSKGADYFPKSTAVIHSDRKPSLGAMLDFDRLPAPGFKNISETVQWPGTKKADPYLTAAVQAGFYDAHPEKGLSAAVSNGQAALVTRLLDRVSNWDAVNHDFSSHRSPIVIATEVARGARDPQRKEAQEASVLAFLEGVLKHKQEIGFVHSIAAPDSYHPLTQTVEPFRSVATAGFNKVVALYLQQGFDLDQQYPARRPNQDNKRETVLEELERVQADSAPFIRSYLVREKTYGILNSMEKQNKTGPKGP